MYLIIFSFIIGLQCVQRALLSSALHALQAYDEGEYYFNSLRSVQKLCDESFSVMVNILIEEQDKKDLYIFRQAAGRLFFASKTGREYEARHFRLEGIGTRHKIGTIPSSSIPPFLRSHSLF